MDLLDAIEGLQVKASALESQTDDLLAQIRQHSRPDLSSKPFRKNLEEILENSFLQPSTSLDEAWLNKLQQ